MRKFAGMVALGAVALLLAGAGKAVDRGEPVGDFSLIDHLGKFHQLSRYADHEAVVLFAHVRGGRDSNRALAAYNELVEAFAGRNVAFFVLDSSGETGKSAVGRDAGRNGVGVPVLMDDTGLVAKALGLGNAAEVAILDPERRESLFRGVINDRFAAEDPSRRASRHYATDALGQILASGASDAPMLASGGAAIAFKPAPAISYAEDIVPILERRCVSCHTEGGIAPFAMSSHQIVRGWSPMIREVLYTKRMPPGQIDNDYVHDFKDVSHITIEETQTLVQWIDDGADFAGGEDPLPGLQPEQVKWSHGEPDLVLPIPAQQIPATGIQDYRNIMVPLPIEEDIWVRAVEFEAGDPTVLHHIIAFAYGPDGLNEFEVLNQGIGLGAYAPGNEINTYPEGAGFPLKAGGGLFLQMHYTTSGRETIDASEVALYLWDEEPERVVLGGSAAEFDIDIAPFSRQEMTATKTFRADSYLSMLGPHMHFRGFDARFRLTYPNGESAQLLNVPNYQFNWQKTYDFKAPLFVPAGSVLKFSGTFDNTAMNPFNPDPSDTLSWGEQSWQEMFFGFIRYVEAEPGEASD
ncbi:MAG: redoxin domain-containing protein [Gammaproteobacteria bacterium]|nr:redoxin domain-containing protein [Gammaproteobacteria bacterium]